MKKFCCLVILLLFSFCSANKVCGGKGDKRYVENVKTDNPCVPSKKLSSTL